MLVEGSLRSVARDCPNRYRSAGSFCRGLDHILTVLSEAIEKEGTPNYILSDNVSGLNTIVYFKSPPLINMRVILNLFPTIILVIIFGCTKKVQVPIKIYVSDEPTSSLKTKEIIKSINVEPPSALITDDNLRGPRGARVNLSIDDASLNYAPWSETFKLPIAIIKTDSVNIRINLTPIYGKIILRGLNEKIEVKVNYDNQLRKEADGTYILNRALPNEEYIFILDSPYIIPKILRVSVEAIEEEKVIENIHFEPLPGLITFKNLPEGTKFNGSIIENEYTALAEIGVDKNFYIQIPNHRPFTLSKIINEPGKHVHLNEISQLFPSKIYFENLPPNTLVNDIPVNNGRHIFTNANTGEVIRFEIKSPNHIPLILNIPVKEPNSEIRIDKYDFISKLGTLSLSLSSTDNKAATFGKFHKSLKIEVDGVPTPLGEEGRLYIPDVIFGMRNFRITHPLYHMWEQRIDVNESTPQPLEVKLKPRIPNRGEYIQAEYLDKIPKIRQAPKLEIPSYLQNTGKVVNIRVSIDENGNVYPIDVIESPSQRQSEIALAIVKQFKFEPPKRMGINVETKVNLPISFDRIGRDHGN